MDQCPRNRWMRVLGAASLLTFLTGCPDQPPAPKGAEPNASPSAATPAAAATASAEPNSFDEVAAQLDRGGSFYMYLSTARLLHDLSGQIGEVREVFGNPEGESPEEREDWTRKFNLALEGIRESGVEEITGAGASTIATAPGFYRTKFFVHHGHGKGQGAIWSLLGSAPHPLEELSLLPANTAFASFHDIDPAQFLGLLNHAVAGFGTPEIKQGYAQALASASAATGIPVEAAMQALTGTAGVIVLLDPNQQFTIPAPNENPVTIPRPSLAIVLPGKDDRIFQQLEKVMGATPGLRSVDEGDLHLRIASEMPIIPGLKIQPTVAKWGQYLILGTDEETVRSLIASKKDGKGFATSPEFAKLSAELPKTGNGFGIQTEAFAGLIARVQLEQMKNLPGMKPEQVARMQKLLTNLPKAAQYTVSTHLDNGWLTVSNAAMSNPAGANRPLVAVLGMVAANAAPAFEKTRETSQSAKSQANARQIAVACLAYASDHSGKFPAAIQELVPKYLPDASVLRSPFAPENEQGYTYVAGLTTSSPRETVLLEDAHSAGKVHQRIVVHVDGSSEIK